MIDSISYVPVREFGELVGATVHWDGKSAYLNNQKIDGKLINHRVYLPVREISERLSLKVSWNDKTNTVTVSK
ncbi:copper amine oxidase N-terminal domain-containing protein [Bacillus chungangensis]|uniref:copper amine oxidase N-terminal domain-containing protein n=1 Tax=Bacillus chungangensis TaxID=587633 RepID=UPI0027D915E7|nr:copper amine oxidase N-terminal domain-containing protein [Bacillus chungangensis]